MTSAVRNKDLLSRKAAAPLKRSLQAPHQHRNWVKTVQGQRKDQAPELSKSQPFQTEAPLFENALANLFCSEFKLQPDKRIYNPGTLST